MANEITIPCLPCRSINDTLTFYQALGFEVTYQQARPNTYAVVQRGGIALHFFALPLEPADSYSTCIVQVPDVDALYQEFAAGLRQHYGKLLVAGIPRITRLRDKSGGRGFNVIDPGGNWIRISQLGPVISATANEPKPAATKLSRAMQAADLLADSKGDFAAAAKMLDAALADVASTEASQQVQALIMRAGFAINLNDKALASDLLERARLITLTETERDALANEFQTADDLELLLT
jgi:catechol 2,3-dioxygenase-like lactoylglutathione lyase family enzyme